MKALGALTLVFVIIMYSVLSWAAVAMNFWNWFLLPVFPTLGLLSYSKAIGLMLFTSVVIKSSGGLYKSELDDDEWATATAQFVLYPWIVLAFGIFIKILIYG